MAQTQPMERGNSAVKVSQYIEENPLGAFSVAIVSGAGLALLGSYVSLRPLVRVVGGALIPLATNWIEQNANRLTRNFIKVSSSQQTEGATI